MPRPAQKITRISRSNVPKIGDPELRKAIAALDQLCPPTAQRYLTALTERLEAIDREQAQLQKRYKGIIAAHLEVGNLHLARAHTEKLHDPALQLRLDTLIDELHRDILKPTKADRE